MSAREIQDQKTIAHEMFVQPVAHANADVSTGPLQSLLCLKDFLKQVELDAVVVLIRRGFSENLNEGFYGGEGPQCGPAS